MARHATGKAAALLPLLFGLVITYPLLRFMLLPLVPAFGPAATPPAGLGPGLGPALGNSLLLATLASLCAVPPAVWLATLLERRRWRGARLLTGTLLLLFLLPGYLDAAGWQILLASPAVAALPRLRDALLGWPGLVGLTALKALPVATIVARAGWAGFQPRLDEATRLHVQSPWRRWTLGLRPVGPAALTALLIVFVEAMHEYGLATTLGARLRLPLLVAEVYASLSTWPISWSRAALAGDLLMLATLAPLAARLWLGRLTPAPLDRALTRPPRAASALESAAGYAATTAIFSAGCAVPLAALFTDAVLPSTEVLPEGAWNAIATSLLYAFVGALGSVGLATALAGSRSGTGLTRWLAWLPLGNLAVPGIVLGAADVIAFNGPPLPLLGTPLALIVAQTATQAPLLALLLHAPMRTRSAASGDAALVHGIPWLDRIERIHLPPLLRPLAWAWCLAFCRLFFELPLAQMLAPAGREPVAVTLVQLQQALRFSAEARLAATAILLCGAIVAVVLALAERAK